MAPDAGECVAVVVDMEAGSLGAILEDAIALIVEKEIRRAIAGVKIRNRVVILIESQVVVVRAEIDVEASVPVVVGEGSVRERSRRRATSADGMPSTNWCGPTQPGTVMNEMLSSPTIETARFQTSRA